MKPFGKLISSIGLMSGTSLDGVDAALIKTDGYSYIDRGPAISLQYDVRFRKRLRAILGSKSYDVNVSLISKDLTKFHVFAIEKLFDKYNLSKKDIDLIGFHGHTLSHNPKKHQTFQIGDPEFLANSLGIDVISDMRSADLLAGGQGAPLTPLYHQACSKNLELPIGILNIGGIANITWIGKNCIKAFDTGPGNSIIDDWINIKSKLLYDNKGELSKKGKVSKKIVDSALKHPYLRFNPPKSLDRLDFTVSMIPSSFTIEDGAATAVEIVVKSIILGIDALPSKLTKLFVTGGGRHNLAIMEKLQDYLEINVQPVETLGWRGDYMEAEAFGYLAVRSLKGLPLSLPSTTGCNSPTSGGVLTKPK